MGKAAEEAKGRRTRRRKLRPGEHEERLSKGDTVHFPGGRLVVQSTGANGGKVKVVVVGGKLVKSKRSNENASGN